MWLIAPPRLKLDIVGNSRGSAIFLLKRKSFPPAHKGVAW
jgi:hypothetical protein